MTRPIRLRYTDSGGTDTLIGQLIGDQNTDIEQAQIKNSGSGEYTHMEIMGNKDLLSAMPTKVSDFQDSYQRIILDVYDVDAGGWVQRDTLFAEDTGKIEGDKGQYRNDQLFGLQKTVGREKVEGIGPINGNVGDVVDALVTASSIDHVVQTNGTLPSVTNYTFNGNIDNAIRDLMRDYPGVLIWWTGQTDGSDNQIVKVEEKGVNSSAVSITYPDPNYELIEYEEEDTSIVVNRATVRGTNSNGDLIEVDTDDFATGQLATDIQTSKDNYGERSLPPRNVGYLEDRAHAEEIAKNLLQLEAQPHLVISLPFQDSNILNQDIDITDSRYDINDTFTVVKQRDFYLDSRTEVELVFEKNLAEQRRAEQRDISEERARLYPSSSTNVDVGEQTFTGDTGSVPSDTQRDPNTDIFNDTQNTQRDPNTGIDDATANEIQETTDSFGDTRTVSSSGWSYMGAVSADASKLEHRIFFGISGTSNGGQGLNLDVVVTDGNDDSVVARGEMSSIGNNDANDITFNAGSSYESLSWVVSGGLSQYKVYVASEGSASGDISYDIVVNSKTHFHTDDIDVENPDHGHDDDIDTEDLQHGGTGDTTGQHGTSGTTDPKSASVDAAQEDKTDR